MKWKKLLSGAGVLGACAAAAKLIGAFFRIPLTNILGAEGIGLYQMVFPLYTVLLTVSSGGFSGAISKAVALAMAKKDSKAAVKILKVAVSALSILAGAAAVFLVIFRGKIATVQGNAGASLAYLGIAPALLFVGVISCLRGYFQGLGNMLPSGISQIIEQLIKLVFGLYFARLLLPKGVEFAVLGAVLGITLSELFAMLILLTQFFIGYYKGKKAAMIPIKKLTGFMEAGEDFAALSMVNNALNLTKSSNKKVDVKKTNTRFNRTNPVSNALIIPSSTANFTTGEILKSLYKIAIPITLGSLIMPLSQVIDSVLVINVLSGGGMGRLQATSLFGLISGPISSLINMPIAIMLSISVALLPRLAYLKEKNGETAGISDKNAKNGLIIKDNQKEYSGKFADIADDAYRADDADIADDAYRAGDADILDLKTVKNGKSNLSGDKANLKRKKVDYTYANQNKKNKIKKPTTPSDAATNALKITLLLALPAATVFMAFSDRIVALLYSGGLSEWEQKTAASLLKIESLSILYISLIQIATAVLQSADKPHRPAINLLYGAVTKVILTLILLPLLGIRGAAAASVVCYATIAAIDLIYMRKVISLKLNRLKSVIMPLIACVLMVGLAYLGFWLFGMAFSPVFATVGGLGLGAIGYAAFLLVTKSVSISELFG